MRLIAPRITHAARRTSAAAAQHTDLKAGGLAEILYRMGRYAPPVHMIKLTEKREITPYV